MFNERMIRAGITKNNLGYVSVMPPLDLSELDAVRAAVGRTPNNFHGATEIITEPDEDKVLDVANKLGKFLSEQGYGGVRHDDLPKFWISCNEADTIEVNSVWPVLTKRGNVQPSEPTRPEE